MSQDLYELLARRRMCRAYLKRTVPRAQLLRVLEAARKSPSAGHAQGVRFAVATSELVRSRIAKAVGEDEYLRRGFYPWFGEAPVHIVVASEPQAYESRYNESDKGGGVEQWPVPYGVLDAGKALMALYLAAEREGLSCGYLGPHRLRGLLEQLDTPSSWELMGLVSLGFRQARKERPSRSHRRGWREFEEVVRWLD